MPYNLQRASYSGARQALECILDHISTTNDDDVLWGIIQKVSPETRYAASHLPDTIIRATRKVKESLITRLESIDSKPIDAADFKAVLDKQRKANADMVAAQNALGSQVNNDLQILAKTPANDAEKKRIEEETKLVPLNLQTETSLRLVSLPAEIATCVAGY